MINQGEHIAKIVSSRNTMSLDVFIGSYFIVKKSEEQRNDCVFNGKVYDVVGVYYPHTKETRRSGSAVGWVVSSLDISFYTALNRRG